MPKSRNPPSKLSSPGDPYFGKPYSKKRVGFDPMVAVKNSQGLEEEESFFPLNSRLRKKPDSDSDNKMSSFGFSTTTERHHDQLTYLKLLRDNVNALINNTMPTEEVISDINHYLDLLFTPGQEPITDYTRVMELKTLLEKKQDKMDVLTKINEWENTPAGAGAKLWFAVDNGNFEMVQELCTSWLNNAVVLNWQNPDNNYRTPLHMALYDTDLMAILLRTPGINVNSVDYYGKTPLFKAALDGYIDATNLLIATRGIDLDKVPTKGNDQGKTPLDIALQMARENPDCFTIYNILIAAGAERGLSGGSSTRSKKRKGKTKRKHLIKKFRKTKSKKNKRTYKKTMHNKGKEHP